MAVGTLATTLDTAKTHTGLATGHSCHRIDISLLTTVERLFVETRMTCSRKRMLKRTWQQFMTLINNAVPASSRKLIVPLFFRQAYHLNPLEYIMNYSHTLY